MPFACSNAGLELRQYWFFFFKGSCFEGGPLGGPMRDVGGEAFQ